MFLLRLYEVCAKALKKKATQRNNYQWYLRIETKYIECIAGKAEAFFF